MVESVVSDEAEPVFDNVVGEAVAASALEVFVAVTVTLKVYVPLTVTW